MGTISGALGTGKKTTQWRGVGVGKNFMGDIVESIWAVQETQSSSVDSRLVHNAQPISSMPGSFV